MRRYLTEAQVVYIRTLRDGGWSVKEICALYQRAESVIYAVVAGETYSGFGGPLTTKKIRRAREPRTARKLTAEQVVSMRRMRTEEKTPLRVLAETYGLAIPTVSDICSGRHYSDVGGPLTRPYKVYAERSGGRKESSRETTL